MAKFKQRIEARKLRREQGLSISEITQKVGVSKGSVSVWCRDIKLPLSLQMRLHKKMVELGHRGRMKGAEMNKKKRQERIKKYKRLAHERIRTLTERDLLMVGIALHWGEGSKGRRFKFSNSDPEMIILVKKFLTDVMKVEKDRFAVRVLINEIHKPRINIVTQFWLNLLDIPEEQMRAPTFVKVKPKKIYANYDRYYGTLHVSVLRSSGLQYKMLELTNVLKERAGVAQW